MTNSANATPQRIVCAVTHVDEITLDLCREALEHQTVRPAEVFVVSNVLPASSAFNKCLDFALNEGANVLIHVAADCILRENGIERLLKRVNRASTYAVTARGFDIMHGENSPIGAWALNMDIIGEDFRFHDTFKMDMNFCQRIEAKMGAVRAKTNRGYQLGYHHPIWLPREMFHKFRYNAAKYETGVINRFIQFFEDALRVNPDNKVLQIGLIGLKRGAAEIHDFGGPLRDIFAEEWNEVQEIIQLDGSEFFAYHSDFVEIARELLNSDQPLKPMAGNFFATKKKKRFKKANQHGLSQPGDDGDASRKVACPTAFRPKRVALLDRIFPYGIQRIKGARDFAEPIYIRLPAPAKEVYRRLRRRSVFPQPRLKYGAVNEGRKDWDERWQNTDRLRRVLLVASKDFAGSMYKWAEAINEHTGFAARLVAFEYHHHGYPVDLVVPECNASRLSRVLELAQEAGYLHLKDEHSWFLGGHNALNLKLLNALFFSQEFASIPKIFTHYGGYARRFKDEGAYIEAVQKFDARIAMTPDLNYAWFDGAYIPHAIDVEKIPYTWSDTMVFAHAPSAPEKKATYLFEETIQLLPRKHPTLWEGWTADLIRGVSFEECMRRKKRASLFFDQAGRHRVANLGTDDVIGWYGNSAVEAMAFGIPTMAHLSEVAFERAAAAGVDLSDCPVISIERTRRSMIEAFLRFAEADPQYRENLARSTRAFTECFHGYKACGTRLAALYASLAKPGIKVSNRLEKVS